MGDAIPAAERPILAGLYLAKFDAAGLQKLGFTGFSEAFNVIGYALGSPPASIRNYRDEFDPLFPNPREGWHKRRVRNHCLSVLERYDALDFESFSALMNSLCELRLDPGAADAGESSFARRLATGPAAERYFESVQPTLAEFKDYEVENTTQFGCGYDFRLRNPAQRDQFLALEVKGLMEETGNLSLTPREYLAATELTGRFFLFVVKNFRESPYHVIFQDPLSGSLQFRRAERLIVQVSWSVLV